MNQSLTPAYLVCHTRKDQPTTRHFFTDDSLLTARKAALTFVELLFTNRVDDYVDNEETEMLLVEITTPDDPAPVVIAQILHHLKPLPSAVANLDPHYRSHRFRELQNEYYYYYTHRLPTGFGAFSLIAYLKDQPNEPHTFVVLSEAMRPMLSEINQLDCIWESQCDYGLYDPDDDTPNPRQLSTGLGKMS